MQLIDIVDARFHPLHSQTYKTLKLFSIKLLVSTQVYSNPNPLI